METGTLKPLTEDQRKQLNNQHKTTVEQKTKTLTEDNNDTRHTDI